MSEAAVIPFSHEQVGRPKLWSLGRDAVVIVWDVPQAARFSNPQLSVGAEPISPLASLRLQRSDGGMRLYWVLRRESEMAFEAELSTGPVGLKADATVGRHETLPQADPQMLLEGIDGPGRMALVSALFNVWSVMFRLQRNRTFVEILHGILSHIAPNPSPAEAVARVARDLVLVRTSVLAGFGKIDAVYVLGRNGPTRIPGRPHKVGFGNGAREAIYLLVQRTSIPPGDALLVLIGPDGLSIRRLSVPDIALPPIERWFREQAQTAPGLREHLLLDIAERSDAGRALSLEVQLRSPLRPLRIASSRTAPSAEIVSALATPAGTLVTGWYRDPVELFAGIDAIGPAGTLDLTEHLHRFPVEVAGPAKGARLPATGFATLAPLSSNTTPLLQPRFRLRLRSGASHALVPIPQPADPVEARAAALRAVPPQHVDEAVLEDVLAPVIASLHEQARTRIGTPTVQAIGTPVERPKASVIIPLYKALDFLRFQIAAFATDPWFRAHAELIYVLDSPDQAQEVQHLMGGLNLIYGLPMSLAVMERNGGYARANNVGAALARGDVLALVNSDVIPTSRGWLEALISRLSGRKRIGAVGPKLLFEDGSIQHAGMYFSKDHHGRWLNQHYHKGMPRDYAPAREDRFVPAVTGACLVTSRAVFESVGGFTEDYVVGDYEDSDLCLKITMTDRKIAYAPDVELYHLERRSMSLNAEYMRGIAWQYNCALHTKRWGGLMASLMQPPGRQRKLRNAAV